MRKWLPLGMLASAQFVMVLDTSVMNVAISQLEALRLALGARSARRVESASQSVA